MWTSTILSKRKEGDAFFVDVSFTNGNRTFVRNIDMTGGTIETLNLKVKNMLDTLNSSDTLDTSVNVGAFTPSAPAQTNQEKFQAAVSRLYAAERAVNLGFITKSDAQYTTPYNQIQTAISNNPNFVYLM